MRIRDNGEKIKTMLFSKEKITQVRKRDGRIVSFEQEKIIAVILKALEATKELTNKKALTKAQAMAEEVTEFLNKKFHPHSIPAVEEIQDIIEEVLMKNKLFRTAKAFILYRDQHAKMREMEAFINSDQLMEGYLQQLDWRVRENSNMNYSLQGLNNHVAAAVSSHYWLNKIYPPEIRQAHNEGDLHIHNLQTLAAYCAGWDLKDLLSRGFRGAIGKVECRPAKHFRSALGQAVNFMYTLQGEIAGAQALANFDTLFAPFIRADGLNEKEAKQCIQEFIYNMNVPTRVGFQTPFSNLTFDLVVPDYMKNEPVILGGVLQKETYGGFQKEMDILNRAFAEVMVEGDATGRVFTFPIPTYNITKNFQWDYPAWESIWEMTAKYGIPYFANFVQSDMKPEDIRSMCCRLRLDQQALRSRGGGLFAAYPLTGSIGVVTINMPRIGYLSKTKEEFFERLKQLMILAKKSLEIKRQVLEKQTEEGLYPYSRFYLQSIKEHFKEYWRNHFNTIGLIGVNEACLNFLKKDITSEEGQKFAGEILDFMRQQLLDFQAETNELYNLEATPAEGTSYGLAKMDKKKFPDIIVANEKAHQEKAVAPYYTNSTQLPVDFTDDLFAALELQDPLQVKYTGGTVLHAFIGERLANGEAAKTLVRKVIENYHLPYLTITPTFSICPTHGYLTGEHFYCPQCTDKKQTCEVYSRIVGYLRPVQQWNDGKQEEFKDRKEYTKLT